MEKIKLVNIKKQNTRVDYVFYCEGSIANAFRKNVDFFVDYDFKIFTIPNSILVIPFLTNVLPVAWLYDATIEIEEIDENYLSSIEEIKKIFAKLYPNLAFKGKIVVNKIVSNRLSKEEDRSMLFYSGGVGSVDALINLLNEKPILATMWGNDLFFHESDGWDEVIRQTSKVAEEYDLECRFFQTSFRYILNYEILNAKFAKPNLTNWWQGFQKELGILSHGAVMAYYYGIKKIYISQNNNVKNREDYAGIKLSKITNSLKFSSASCFCVGENTSRNDKVESICDYVKNTGKKMHLRVCWEQRDGKNCCICEKCIRTFMNILTEDLNPQDFGFDFSDELYDLILSRLNSNVIKLSMNNWGYIIQKISEKPELIQKNLLANYLVKKYPKYAEKKYTYIPTVIEEKQTTKFSGILLERPHDYSNTEIAFESVGLNTGNLVFRDSLIKNLDLLNISYEAYEQIAKDIKNVPIVVTDLIWINENSNFDYLYERVKKNKNTAFVPMSVGLQAKDYEVDFKLNESTKNVLSAMQERAIIGVRGEYTATILEKNGIKNIDIIGCPSLYYENDSNLFIKKSDEEITKVCANFRTFYGLLNKNEKHFLTYCANKDYDFVEQTSHEFVKENAADDNYYNYVSKWLNRKKKVFFDTNEWKDYMKGFQFSMGPRFHGNVMALWNRIPALFMSIDSRTEELVRYFELPYIKMSEFDENQPIEYYYELADYTEFNSNFKLKYLKYMQFLRKNNIVK
ncbi:Polysaccharide pyruvyl transferase [Acetitomaculum ruminis DSM 5522]|uniref:Polysaccharide pyruvyl transferase n=1 Tax=Acetitomaculum ruminis DSM 5522 TaxID=1120918 RepID=A0A1I0VJ39_9FIRM|nr:polysaccharide pyruvyl transferase family protein [Acetitomaculum ruminis]SFA76519.1 Polysaccharide pyruvyl transferase [Acetitomaculum ruminis DSM 5522]